MTHLSLHVWFLCCQHVSCPHFQGGGSKHVGLTLYSLVCFVFKVSVLKPAPRYKFHTLKVAALFGKTLIRSLPFVALVFQRFLFLHFIVCTHFNKNTHLLWSMNQWKELGCTFFCLKNACKKSHDEQKRQVKTPRTEAICGMKKRTQFLGIQFICIRAAEGGGFLEIFCQSCPNKKRQVRCGALVQ